MHFTRRGERKFFVVQPVHGPPPPNAPTESLFLPAIKKKGEVSRLPNITKVLPKEKLLSSVVLNSISVVT